MEHHVRERKYYIDNLRWIATSMLLVFHSCMIFNNWGEANYVNGKDNALLAAFPHLTWPWYMPLLFVLAGMSTRYAFQKRSTKEYAKNRFMKLLVPSIAIIVTFIPIITYYAERFHNQYKGSFLKQYVMFFTKPTDLTGYMGGFTPSHMWFALYLFIISMVALPMIHYKEGINARWVGRMNIISLIMLFVIPMLMQVIVDIEGKSLGEYFGFFMIGYFVVAEEKVQDVLEKNRFVLLGLFAALVLIQYFYEKILFHINPYLAELSYGLYAFIGVYCMIAWGRHCLNVRNVFTDFMSKASFGVYMFHQTWVVVVGYYVLKTNWSAILQFAVILILATIITFTNYLVLRPFKWAQVMFAVK